MMKVLLKDACSIIMGQSPDSKSYNNQGDGLPFYQGNADFGDVHPITRVWCASPIRIAKEGDILISVRAPIGAMNIATTRCCIGRGLAALRPNEADFDNQFLFYVLQSMVDRLIEQGTGSTFKAIGKSILENTELPYYSLAEQAKIVSELNKLGKAIVIKKTQLALLDEVVKSRFVEMFESNWKMIPLEQCCISISGGSTPSMAQSSYYGGDVPFIKSGDVKDSKISSGSLWLTQEALHKGRAKLVPSGTVIVVTRSGILKHFLPVAIALNPLVVNQDIKALQPKERFKSDYLAWAIRMNESLLLSKSRMTTVDNIESGDLYQLPIKDVSLALQNRFSEFVEQVDKSKLVIKKTLSELEELKDSLMQKYFFD